MIKVEHDNGKRKLILFVHGFTGGEETWKHSGGDYFWNMLATEESINAAYDIGHYSYYTAFSETFTNAKNIVNSVRRMFSKSYSSSKKNLDINELASILRSEIKYTLASYDEVVIIAHSMGGLIAKGCVLKDIDQGELSKIKFLISLAVPYRGADLAAFGKLLSNNKQIIGLDALSSVITEQNDKWVKTSLKPAVKYLYAAYDTIVKKESAVAVDTDNHEAIAVDEDHITICKPVDKYSLVFKAVKDMLDKYSLGEIGNVEAFPIKKLSSDAQYEDEVFVLKLIIADVVNVNIKNSKEYFLNAEIIRKQFSSDYDQKRLVELYDKIRGLYQDSYAKYASNQLKTSDELVNEVHEKIIKEDSTFLKSLLPRIHAIHKKGMLHQLANKKDGDIWWSEIQDINKLKGVE